MHFPAGIVPVTEVLEGEEEKIDIKINDRLTKAFRNSMKGSKGMPISV